MSIVAITLIKYSIGSNQSMNNSNNFSPQYYFDHWT